MDEFDRRVAAIHRREFVRFVIREALFVGFVLIVFAALCWRG